MLRQARSKPLCSACSRQLLDLFANGLASTPTRHVPHTRPSVATFAQRRAFRPARLWRQIDSTTQRRNDEIIEDASSPEQQREDKVRAARQLFGESLPLDYLSVEEYQVYERLYGAPLKFTRPEDDEWISPVQEGADVVDAQNIAEGLADGEPNVLLKEGEDGLLEQVEYTQAVSEDFDHPSGEEEFSDVFEQTSGDSEGLEAQDFWMIQDLEKSRALAKGQAKEKAEDHTYDSSQTDSAILDSMWEAAEETEEPTVRTHPLTSAGHFATSPRSVILPAAEMTEPIQSHLAKNAKYEHLIDAARKTFGMALQDSNATPPKKGLQFQQKSIPLSAYQFSMSKLEANLFLSTIMPGAYSTTMSILVEVRKRLGSSWLEEVMARPGGPRVLDAGGGGASVIAWREILKAEWERMHAESGRVAQSELNLGSSTVLAGSRELQAAVSQLLGDTSFIPRLPDFNRRIDMKTTENESANARKQYDLIVAPYSIWQIEEDFVKKNHVQNLWSLLDPNGGVLVLVEKGLPRGFEAIAGAREVLLSHHIKNPQKDVQMRMEDVGHKHTHMEDGMIIAPCTNHTKCPMYKIPGEMVGRRDFCSFQQRFERPPFLQRINGGRFHNFEDINFSYLAVRRGKDLRAEKGFKQDVSATEAALKGFEHAEVEPEMLALPRIVGDPIKRTGHVTLDLCTPHGSFERWTTPKSFSKQAYRDGRKSQWGDLWALGAKTRIDRNVQTGWPKGEKPAKILKAIDDMKDSSAALRQQVERELASPVKVKKGDKGWKEKLGRRDKYGAKPMTRKVDRKALEEAM